MRKQPTYFSYSRYHVIPLIITIQLFLLCSAASAQNITNPTDTLSSPASIQKYLKQQADSSYVYKKLYEWLVTSKSSNVSKHDLTLAFDRANQQQNNKIIREVKIKQVSPFAKNILDTVGVTTNNLEKNLNKLRFETQTSIIKNNLTFKNGEFSKYQKIRDSERILRSLNFITDALIIAEPDKTDSTLVDILVITQDSYPYGVNTSLSATNARLGIYSTNVLGFGLELEHSLSTVPTDNRDFGFYEHIRWENIYGSFITLDAEWSDLNRAHYINVGAHKDFFIPEIKYAGGFHVKKNHKIHDPEFEDVYDDNYDYLIQDFWLGKSILINAENFFDRSNLTFMGQTMISNYNNLSDSMMQMPHYKPNLYVFGSVSFSKRDFYKNELIYNYGRTEDVPYGFNGALSFGYNHNNAKNRPYLGAHFSLGKALIPNKGFLYFGGEYQTYLYNGHPEDSRIKLQTKYISSLKNVGRHRWRSFVSLNYVIGMHHSRPNYLFINEANEGIRALRNFNLRGTTKLVFNSENILFSSKELLGFKMAFFTFYDMAWLSTNDQLLESKPYFSLGGGIRIRNDHLVFNTIQLQLAFFPRIPPEGSPTDFNLSGEKIGQFNQFGPRKPYVDIYK